MPKKKKIQKIDKKILNELKHPKKDNFWIQFFITMLITMVIFNLFFAKSQTQQLSLSELASDVKQGKVESILVKGDNLEVFYKPQKQAPTTNQTPITNAQEDPLAEFKSRLELLRQSSLSKETLKKVSKKEPNVSIVELLRNYGVDEKTLSNVEIKIQDPSGFKYWFTFLVPLVLPIFLIFLLILYFSKQMGKTGMQPFSFGNSKARFIDPKDKNQKVTFKDVAGAKEAKEELKEIVDFLKSPKKFIEIGARIPKGVLLMGSSGTGKTLLARAVAGEANVPFFSISGSEFVEMFVGVGASRVRDLFAQAKKHAPAIIFIDEIDAVGRARGIGTGGGNDEREQTLNQILVEMDGFEPNDQVIVMAATNRPDVLDPALVRPGRFDRRIVVDLPDRKDREEILKIHARKKKLHGDVDLKVIAERTPGFSGADLANLMNEAAILAARENRKEITQYDLIRSIEKVMLGPERKSHVLNEKEKKITAYHEAGHALVASVLPQADPVHKISIISRGRAAGYTLKLPIEEKKMQTKQEYLEDIAVGLGGYIAEKLVFGDVTTGPSNDLEVLTSIARNMVTRWGMSDKVGTIVIDSPDDPTGFGLRSKEHSEKLAALIDEETEKIIKQAYKMAEEAIIKHKALLDEIARVLLEKETIEKDEFNEILKGHGIIPKKSIDDESVNE